MKFRALGIPGVTAIDLEKREDFRGFFARIWCQREFAQHGLISEVVQASVAFNVSKGTLRGLHFQAAPRREARIVRCVAGSAFFAVVDLRPGQGTFLEHTSIVLDTGNRTSVYVPPGCALGYQTLEDGTEILYHMTEFYDPSSAAGFRWNDPAFGISWPEGERNVLERDNAYPDFDPREVAGFNGY